MCDEHLGEWAQRWTERADEILTGFRREYLRHCERMAGRITEDLSAVSLPEIDVAPGDRRPVRENSLQIVREAAMNYNVIGGVAGEAAKWLGFGAGIATGFGLISNPDRLGRGAAAGVGYVATKIWAAVRGVEMARERTARRGDREPRAERPEHGAEAQKSATRAFERLSAALDSAAKAQIDGFRSAMKNDFTARRQEINQGKTRTAAENREAEEKIKKSLAQYQELLASYQEIKRGLDAGGAA